MEKLLSYVKKQNSPDIETETTAIGNSYFNNVKPFKGTGLYIYFTYSNNPEICKKTVTAENRIKKYCKRYGYSVIYDRTFYDIHTATLLIVKNTDRDILETYEHFTRLSVADCEKEMHNFSVLKPATGSLESNLKKIMDYYGNNLNECLAALYERGKTGNDTL